MIDLSNLTTECGYQVVVSSCHKPKATQLISTHVRPNPKSKLFPLLLIFKFKDRAFIYISIHKAHYVC